MPSSCQPPAILPSVTEYLFQRCLQLLGWRHAVDIWLQRASISFLGFLGGCNVSKAMVKMLRRHASKAHVAKFFRGMRSLALAGFFWKLSFTSFATCRWSTLRDCCVTLGKVFDTLKQHWSRDIIGRTWDATRSKQVNTAFLVDEWGLQFTFVPWLLGRISHWIGACDCHAAEIEAGLTIACDKKDCRMASTWCFDDSRLRCGLPEANGWTLDAWGLGIDFWRVAQSTIQQVFNLGQFQLRLARNCSRGAVAVQSA